ncbi:hypothetical protein TMU01_13430 [Tenuibacillus multivorans]|nr:hypothetical protein TMU01_13430 [Tenuibacillus multivorans]
MCLWQTKFKFVPSFYERKKADSIFEKYEKKQPKEKPNEDIKAILNKFDE